MIRPLIDDDAWREAGRVFHDAVDLSDEERAIFLAQWPPHTPIRRALDALLQADGDSHSSPAIFDRPQEHCAHESDPLGLVGTELMQFEVQQFVAIGGMGLVYRAFDTRLERQVA